MAESEKIRYTDELQQVLADAKTPWQRVGAVANYLFNSLMGGSARRYSKSSQYTDTSLDQRESTSDQNKHEDLRKMTE